MVYMRQTSYTRGTRVMKWTENYIKTTPPSATWRVHGVAPSDVNLCGHKNFWKMIDRF